MHNILLTFIVAIGVVGSSARAQKPDAPRIPQAISDSELHRYSDLLGLSDDQRHAAEGEYERYLDDFEPLRVEMIELAVRYPPYSLSEPVLIKALPGFVAVTRSADEALFARIEPLLIDAQRPALLRVRMLRERTLLSNLEARDRIIEDGIPDQADLDRSRPITYEQWKHRPLLDKLLEDLASLLGSQL